MVRVGNAFIEILEYRSPHSRAATRALADLGWGHVCLQVDDVDRDVDRFVEAGCTARSRPVDMGDGWACYLDDPWGNTIELWEISDATVSLPH